MYELQPTEYDIARPLFRAMAIHGAVEAVLVGRSAGKVYVDDRKQPGAALVRVEHRLYLSGRPDDAFMGAFRRAFLETLLPEARASGAPMYVLAYAPGEWTPALDEALADLQPIKGLRHYYAAQSGRWQGAPAALPPGYALRAVDRALLAETDLENYDELRREMGSERASVDEFLKERFGVCVVRDNELAGWCLSEYNEDARCEVGIETVAEHRRRGLGTAMATALIVRAFARGIAEVGWHCYASNTPSIATACKAGMVRIAEYPVYFGFHDGCVHLSVHGGTAFEQGRHTEALRWFEQAFERAAAPNWAYMLAARASALLGQRDAALRYLAQAIDRGFVYLEIIQDTQEFQALHDTSEWKTLIAKLGGE